VIYSNYKEETLMAKKYSNETKEQIIKKCREIANTVLVARTIIFLNILSTIGLKKLKNWIS
jgi:hypothetical protein